MNNLQRLRGLFGMAGTWALLWIPLGWVAAIIDALIRSRPVDWVHFPADAVPLAAIGGACGLLFGLVLTIAERRRTFARLTLPRMAVWGLAAGLVIPGAYAAVNGVTAAIGALIGYGAINATLAVTTLAVARQAHAIARGPAHDALPGSSE